MEQINTSFLSFWKDLFLHPRSFFRKYFNEQQPLYFTLAIVVFGIGYGIDRLDRQLTKFDLRGRLDDVDFINNWVGYWAFAIIGGIIGGYILYLIGGWFFNVRLKWSKGTSNIEKSRHIYLYSGVISSTVIILTTVVSMFLNNKPYDSESESIVWDLVSMILLLFFLYYSVYVSYCGVRTITNAEKVKSRIWFLILPMGVYTIAYTTLFALLIKYMS